MKIIKGPIAQLASGNVIYQVTLASGMIVTNPAAFGAIERDLVAQKIVVTNDGRVLIALKENPEPTPANP